MCQKRSVILDIADRLVLIITSPCQTRYYAPRYVSPIPRAYHASIQANPALHQWQDKFGAAIRCLPRERGAGFGADLEGERAALFTVLGLARALIAFSGCSLLFLSSD
jgi:hypothetical protein